MHRSVEPKTGSGRSQACPRAVTFEPLQSFRDGIPLCEKEGESNVIPSAIVYSYFPFKLSYHVGKRLWTIAALPQ
jgi:hypothetical protein